MFTQMAWRAAQDIGDGLLVNLGMGMPVHVADYLRPEVDVFGIKRWQHPLESLGPPAEHAPEALVITGSLLNLRPAQVARIGGVGEVLTQAGIHALTGK